MPEPLVRILGVYKIEPTEALFNRAMEQKYGGIDLTPAQRKEAERAVREERASIALFEVAVDFPNDRFDVGHFRQSGSDQAPYDEAYLSPDGSTIISRWKKPAGDALRFTFFLHFFDRNKPLETPYGEMSVPALQQVPERLSRLVPYRPVD